MTPLDMQLIFICGLAVLQVLAMLYKRFIYDKNTEIQILTMKSDTWEAFGIDLEQRYIELEEELRVSKSRQ